MPRIMCGGRSVSEAWTPQRGFACAREVVATCEDDPGKVRQAVPEKIAGRFVNAGRGQYYSDGALAFTVCCRRLKAETSSVKVVRSLLDIAAAWGWTTLAVNGPEDFCRQVWREATDRGIAVTGYAPTAVESGMAAEKRARREGSYAVNPTAGRPERRDRLSGTLIAAGGAEGDPDAYVTLRTARGEVTKRGPDVGRALGAAEGGPVAIGEQVTLADVGAYPCCDGPGCIRRYVIERTGTDIERRLAETVAGFAPAKPADGSGLRNSQQEADERREAMDARAMIANDQAVPKGNGNGGAARAARRSAEKTAEALKATRMVADQTFTHGDECAKFIAAVRRALHDMREHDLR